VANNWVDTLLPLPRPEYAKQTESLLTDLIWRSPGSSLRPPGQKAFHDDLSALKQSGDDKKLPEPERLVPRVVRGSATKTVQMAPLAMSLDLSALILASAGTPRPAQAMLYSLDAPKGRGDKSIACVPIHPALVALQTLHGLVNKTTPSHLANAIEKIAWLGGAREEGAAARSYLSLFTSTTSPRDGATGSLDWLLPLLARHAWSALPAEFGKPGLAWRAWPSVGPNPPGQPATPSDLETFKTPFSWFWTKWKALCTPDWFNTLPNRRFVDWALCLLRTGLAFAYLWEAEFFTRVHEIIAASSGPLPRRLQTLLSEGAVLAVVEPTSVPPSQKSAWTAIGDLIARGWKARAQVLEALDVPGVATDLPVGPSPNERIIAWASALAPAIRASAAAPLRTSKTTANNQKEFVRYLLLPRSSDDDTVDQADFYSLARTNGRHLWFKPGPEWLVVVTSLLCGKPGDQCTLGGLTRDLGALGVRIERPVLVELLEEAGLSVDSPDADDALVIRSGF